MASLHNSNQKCHMALLLKKTNYVVSSKENKIPVKSSSNKSWMLYIGNNSCQFPPARTVKQSFIVA